MGYNRVFGYYFELSRAQQQPVPDYFERRQSLVNAERFVTPELKELESKLISASEKRNELEYRLFQELRVKIAEERPRLLFMAGLIAQIDYWQALAECARKKEWTKPVLDEGNDIEIKDGRHPVVEAVIGKSHFIPNDLIVNEKKRLLLITGPNMAGKSTVLRQSALICMLAQMGAFVPAAFAKIGIVDRIFSRVGASDNISQGQSTFMVEMMETARILRQATKKSFVILDEIGRGTSTFDGLALAWAVMEELLKRANGQVRTLFATHYHELTALENKFSGIFNMNIAIKEWNNDIVFCVSSFQDLPTRVMESRLRGSQACPPMWCTGRKNFLFCLKKIKKNQKSGWSGFCFRGWRILKILRIKPTLFIRNGKPWQILPNLLKML